MQTQKEYKYPEPVRNYFAERNRKQRAKQKQKKVIAAQGLPAQAATTPDNPTKGGKAN